MDSVLLQHEYPPGTVIEIGEHRIMVIEYCDENPGLIKVILINWNGDKEKFGDNSDWNMSSLRQKMNYGETYKKIQKIFGESGLYYFPREIATIGGIMQGTSCDIVSLLTIEEYSKYRELFDGKFDHTWWLLTPRSSIGHGDELSVFYVLKNGLVDFQLCGFRAGILPVVTTDISIFNNKVIKFGKKRRKEI